jgi:SAM-dependent methyltransferase
VLTLTPTPPANAFVSSAEVGGVQPAYPLEVHFCVECTHAQLLDVVSPEDLFSDYVYVSGTSAVFRDHFARYASEVMQRYPMAAQELVVDIGSNDGTLLRCFQALDCRMLGIDPARDIAAKATEAGVETIEGFFTPALALEIREKHGPAAVVTANNVFAHIDDLGAVVEGVRTLLKPDGVFVFEVSYLVDVLEKTLFDTIYHEHLSYHSVGPLVRFFQANGMELIGTDRVDSHGGSLRGFVQIKGGPHPVAQSVNDRLAEEKELGLNRPEALLQFGDRITAVRDTVMGLLDDLRGRGAKVAGYGAPAKATTLLYHFGIEPETLEYIVDDSPLKQGLHTPGLHIPVLPATVLETQPVDCLFILAWNFADSIMENLKPFRAAGGQFLVPLPKPKIQ